MAKYVKIPIKEYVELLNRDTQLSWMEVGGVDNWENGYSKEEFMKDCEMDKFEITEEDIDISLIIEE